ncbi:8-oxo-dGTP diphosphatase [Flavobacterium segetis]|uniref:8-oxo-dGTP diphosphatase n=1 Tax=Flavobacterium segetis TaxID=271157 RepID=A0A1M5EG66_9FLAO|nr:(deoxy)nucleoside triphosphate pyrophosphohydrolase [Flavobacterium segetis]SHF78160.1 8-oxo-dGTP diphosphatase [Flavobacterium segetis]
MFQKKQIDVTCAIVYFNNKILVTQRSDKMKLPLKWEFPGGKLEDGETKEDCIKREILEEINIEIEIVGTLTNSLFDYGSFKVNLIPFIANYKDGSIKLSEHKDFKLVHKEQLLDLDWAEADLPIVRELLNYNL